MSDVAAPRVGHLYTGRPASTADRPECVNNKLTRCPCSSLCRVVADWQH